MLKTLISHPGRVYSRQLLLQLVWGDADYRDARTVDVHIRHLREKLETDAQGPRVHLHGPQHRLQVPRVLGYTTSEVAVQRSFMHRVRSFVVSALRSAPTRSSGSSARPAPSRTGSRSSFLGVVLLDIGLACVYVVPQPARTASSSRSWTISRPTRTLVATTISHRQPTPILTPSDLSYRPHGARDRHPDQRPRRGDRPANACRLTHRLAARACRSTSPTTRSSPTPSGPNRVTIGVVTIGGHALRDRRRCRWRPLTAPFAPSSWSRRRSPTSTMRSPRSQHQILLAGGLALIATCSPATWPRTSSPAA